MELAKRFPECIFKIAGMNKPELFNLKTENVHFLGNLNPEKLKAEYQKVNFYFQLSVFEGFGCALCEAMLCGCTPIGSKVNIIPEIIGETGYILEHRDINILEKLIRRILELPQASQINLNARQRIIEKYSLENRKKMLLSSLTFEY
jgi:glycosyltransferase involved in cell wall biosynthesis